MHFGQYSYLVTTLIIAFGAVLFEWLISFKNLWKQRKVLGIVVFICVMGAIVGESTAIKWRAWLYNPERTLNFIFLGIPIETYLWTVLIVIAIASATIQWSKYERQGKPLIRTTWVKLKDKLRKWRK